MSNLIIKKNQKNVNLDDRFINNLCHGNKIEYRVRTVNCHYQLVVAKQYVFAVSVITEYEIYLGTVNGFEEFLQDDMVIDAVTRNYENEG